MTLNNLIQLVAKEKIGFLDNLIDNDGKHNIKIAELDINLSADTISSTNYVYSVMSADEAKDKDKETILGHAIWAGNFSLVRYICSTEISVDDLNNTICCSFAGIDFNALFYSISIAELNKREIVKVLLKKGVNSNQVQVTNVFNGNTPLERAENDDSLASLLREYGAR